MGIMDTATKYGTECMEAFLMDHASPHPRNLIQELREELKAWAEGVGRSGDITMPASEFGLPPKAVGTITLPATIDNLQQAFEFIHEELEKQQCPMAVQMQIDVALEELFVNVCHYAYEKANEPGDIRLDYVYKTHPRSLVVCLTDWGAPFNPLGHEDPTAPKSIAEAKIGGLGIFMAKRLTDHLSYLRDGNKNVVAFQKTW